MSIPVANSLKEQLIELVRMENCIWDKKNPDHFKNPVIEKAWRRIVRKLDPDQNHMGVDFRRTWKLLRDAYRVQCQNIAKKQRSGAAAENCVSNWPFFNQMSFLKDQFMFRECAVNEAEIICENDKISVRSSTPSEIRNMSDLADTSVLGEAFDEENLSGVSTSSPTPKKRRCIDPAEHLLAQIVKIAAPPAPTTVSCEKDLAGILCRKFAQDLEKLPFEAQIRAYVEIQAIIGKHKEEYKIE